MKLELIHSKKLEDHFAANPDDLQVLKHDGALSTVRKQAHLANVPAYLKPETQGATAEVTLTLTLTLTVTVTLTPTLTLTLTLRWRPSLARAARASGVPARRRARMSGAPRAATH